MCVFKNANKNFCLSYLSTFLTILRSYMYKKWVYPQPFQGYTLNLNRANLETIKVKFICASYIYFIRNKITPGVLKYADFYVKTMFFVIFNLKFLIASLAIFFLFLHLKLLAKRITRLVCKIIILKCALWEHNKFAFKQLGHNFNGGRLHIFKWKISQKIHNLECTLPSVLEDTPLL